MRRKRTISSLMVLLLAAVMLGGTLPIMALAQNTQPAETSGLHASPAETPQAEDSVEPEEGPAPAQDPFVSSPIQPVENPEPSDSPALSDNSEPSNSPESTESPLPTKSSAPTESPEPSPNPTPTESSAPTESPVPTESPAPTESPEPSPEPSPSPTPTAQPLSEEGQAFLDAVNGLDKEGMLSAAAAYAEAIASYTINPEDAELLAAVTAATCVYDENMQALVHALELYEGLAAEDIAHELVEGAYGGLLALIQEMDALMGAKPNFLPSAISALTADDAYITKLSITKIVDGTPAFDANDDRGNDANDSNKVVRSFDSINYTFKVEMESYQGKGPFNQARVKLEFTEGDVFFIHILNETLAYEVDQIKVIEPDETNDLLPVPGQDYITLLTCTPYGVNTHRLLVRGERTEYIGEVHETALLPAQNTARDSRQLSDAILTAWIMGNICLIVLIVTKLKDKSTKNGHGAKESKG